MYAVWICSVYYLCTDSHLSINKSLSLSAEIPNYPLFSRSLAPTKSQWISMPYISVLLDTLFISIFWLWWNLCGLFALRLGSWLLEMMLSDWDLILQHPPGGAGSYSRLFSLQLLNTWNQHQTYIQNSSGLQDQLSTTNATSGQTWLVTPILETKLRRCRSQTCRS